MRSPRAADEHGADDEVGLRQLSLDGQRRGDHRVGPLAEDVGQRAKAIDVGLEDGNVRPHPHRDHGRVVPTTPPPMITTLAAGTPGTPPSSTPRPPSGLSRTKAPACVAILPATSLIGASRGNRPLVSVTVS